MAQILVVTPVKDALENTLQTAKAISASSLATDHFIFNDFSSEETKAALTENQRRIGYTLVNLEELTNTPSPNYKLVLQMAQKEALKNRMPLVIVESDVEVKKDTFEKMLSFYKKHPKAGLIGAITVGYDEKVNFPYLKFRNVKDPYLSTSRSLSFCCTLFSVDFLNSFDFSTLDGSKDWYDTSISKKAVELGYENYVLMDVPVLHKPHGSRPWKQLKYSNPLKYYWNKLWQGKDKI